MIMRNLWLWAVVASVCIPPAPACYAAESAKSAAEWRVVGSFSNAPLGNVACFAGAPNNWVQSARNQGELGLQTVEGATGPLNAAVWDWGIACPSILGPIEARSDGTSIFDLPINWLYQADGLVTGQAFAEMGQTFIATGTELDRVSCAIARKPGAFDVVVRKDGPSGEQVGPTATFTSAEPGQWGIARWDAGAVPLEPGKNYYIGIKSRSAEPFIAQLHSTGDVYPGGCAYFDGVAEPLSDLALLIAQQCDDAVRSPALYATRDDGWVLHTKGVYFKARSANVRAIYAKMKFKDMPARCDAVCRVYRLMPDASIVKAGPEKTCAWITGKDGEQRFGAVYGPDELPVEAGQVYYVELIPKGEGIPADEAQVPKRDLLVTAYGEKVPGAVPVIYNLKTAEVNRTLIKLTWDGAKDCATRVLYGLSPYDLRFAIDVPKGRQEVVISPIRPATTFNFRLIATSKNGGSFETPIYQARTLDAEYKPVIQPPLPAVPREEFLSLAPMDYLLQPPLPQVREVRETPLQNPDFENGLNGWQLGGTQKVACAAIGKVGKSSAGWSFETANKAETDSPVEDMIYQTVDVTRGKSYMLSAYLMTDQPIGTDVQARLVCDPKGGTNFAGLNSTQWFRTGGQWMQFAEVWQADADRMTIGVALARQKDWPKVTALADAMRLVEIR